MKQSLLWKLTKEGHGNSYILGTMHVKSKQVFTRIEQLHSLISEVDTFAAEYHLDEVKFVQQPQDLLLPNGKSIRHFLGEKKFSKLQKIIFKCFNVDLSQFEYYLPLLMINIIGEAVLSKDYHLPLDMHLWKIAKENNKELIGIESYESQQKIMRKINVDDQLKMLKDIARKPAKYRRSILEMGKLYENEEIHNLYRKGKKSLGKYRKVLLTKRNRVMAERFDELATERSMLMAIGAGHLSGVDGVLKLLKEKGWKLKAI